MDLCNRHPILYLGRDRDSGDYYFFGSKQGTGRFLKYQKYPMWCSSAGIGNFIDLSAALPEEVMADVLLFVNGRVEYEIQPKRRGRAEKIIRHEVAPAAPAATEAKASTPVVEPNASSQRTVPPAPAGSTTSQPTQEQAPRRRGRPRKNQATEPPNPGSDGSLGSVVRPAAAAPSKPRRRRSAAGGDVLVQPGLSPERRGSVTELPLVTFDAKPRRKRKA